MKDQTFAKLLKVALVVGGVSALAPMVSAQGIGVRELQKMLVSTPQKVERGEKLYQQNCAVCHGKNGHGMNGVELAGAPGKTFQTVDLTQANYRYVSGPIQMYDVISYGIEDALPGAPAEPVPPHPKFQYLQYQSRWDMVHYVRSLGPTKDLQDPAPIVAKARDRAENGVCDQEIKKSIADKVAPKGEEQMARGKELYDQNCVSCHGAEGKGDGPAAAALTPPPRNYHTTDASKWTNKPSALGIFNTLSNGIAGTSMASYANLPEEDRWALTQYVLHWVPKSVKVESTEAQIVGACRALSAPEKPASIPVDAAMKALVNDQVEERYIHVQQFGPVKLDPQADPERGAQVYAQTCAGCHGDAGAGERKGPYGAQPPYLHIKVGRLVPAMAGGTPDAFAERSYAGVHATLANMTGAALLSKEEWRDLQAYVATFEGEAEITVQSPQPAQPAQQDQTGEQDQAGEQGQTGEAPADANQPTGGQPPAPANGDKPDAKQPAEPAANGQ